MVYLTHVSTQQMTTFDELLTLLQATTLEDVFHKQDTLCRTHTDADLGIWASALDVMCLQGRWCEVGCLALEKGHWRRDTTDNPDVHILRLAQCPPAIRDCLIDVLCLLAGTSSSSQHNSLRTRWPSRYMAPFTGSTDESKMRLARMSPDAMFHVTHVMLEPARAGSLRCAFLNILTINSTLICARHLRAAARVLPAAHKRAYAKWGVYSPRWCCHGTCTSLVTSGTRECVSHEGLLCSSVLEATRVSRDVALLVVSFV